MRGRRRVSGCFTGLVRSLQVSLGLIGLLALLLSAAPERVFAAGKALSFNGSTQTLQIADAAALSPHVGAAGELSVEAWVKLSQLPPTTGQGRGPILAKGSNNGWEYALNVYADGRVGMSVWQLNGTAYAEPKGGSLSLNAWHHVAGTLKKGQFVRVYLDGVLINEQTTLTGDTADGPAPLQFAQRGDGQALAVVLDEARLYSRALSTAEVAAHYNNGTGQYGVPETGLVAGWHLDEGSGTTSADYSGNGRTGTLVNGPGWVTGLIPKPSGADTTPPTISSVTVTPSARPYAAATVTVTASATDASPLEYQFLLDGAVVRAWASSASYSWTSAAPMGRRSFTVQVRDTAQNLSTRSVDVVVLRQPLRPQ